jgi:hypothetical protein
MGRVTLPGDDPRVIAQIEKLSRDPDALKKVPPDELAQLCGKVAPQAGSIVQYAKPIEWIIPGMLPRRSLILVTGEPKKAMKSLLMMHLASVVSDMTQQTEFAGTVPVVKRGMAVIINLEDGRDRLIRRLADFGIKPGDPRPLHAMWRIEGVEIIYEWLRRTSNPAVLIIVDPFVELGSQIAGFDENAAPDVARLLRIYRDIAQMTGATIMMIHHMRKDGTRMRGSSALEAAADGWLNIWRIGDMQRIQSTLRDGHERELDLSVNYGEDRCTVEAVSKLKMGHTVAKKSGGSKDHDEESMASRRDQIVAFVESQDAPVSKNAIHNEVGGNRATVQELVDQLAREGLIDKVGSSERPKFVGSRVSISTPE